MPALAGALALLAGGIVTAMMTTPEPEIGPAIERAAALIEKNEHEPAIELLNSDVFPHLDWAGIPADDRRRYHVLLARAVYLGQKAKGIDREDNHQTILSEYLEAERQEATLESRDAAFLADTYLSLGLMDEALARVGSLPEEERPRRNDLVKRMVERSLASRAGREEDLARAMALLSELLADPALSPGDTLWATARQAEIRLAGGYYDEVITRLLRVIPSLGVADPVGLGEIYLLLGRAYLETGGADEAAKQFQRADELLPESDVRRGEALLLLARIDDQKGNTPEARDGYNAVIDGFLGSRAYLPALLGLGEAEAVLNRDEEALAAYSRVAEALAQAPAGERQGEVTAETVGRSLMSRHTDRFTGGDVSTALRYALLAEGIFGVDRAPAEVLLGLARAHRRIAEDLLADAGVRRPADDGHAGGEARGDEYAEAARTGAVGDGGGGGGTAEGGSSLGSGGLEARPPLGGAAVDIWAVDPVTREEARRGFISAGEYFRKHADRVIEDNGAYADSLWMAADSFDLAGDTDASIAAFNEYAEGFPGDARRAEARFRLAQAHEARGGHEPASKLYRELIDTKSDHADASASGPFGDASYVPLARTYLSDTDPANDAEAERLLRAVVDGSLGGMGSPNFREALVELGRLYYGARRYTEAIERLGESLQRFPEAPTAEATRYVLADAYRLEAKAIEATLREAMPDGRRRELRERRERWLRSALDLFEAVRAGLDAKDPRRATELERVRLRNASFYLGDCAFDLGDFAGAIRAYDTARERYQADPASLVAMVQIVNAYLEQGDTARAATANERAKRFYAGLPAEVWEDPNLPMTRRDWERWLDSSAAITKAGAGTGAGVSATPGGRSEDE